MLSFAKLTAFSILALATVGFASAETIHLASFGTTASAPAGVGNTAVTYGAAGTTYNIGTGNVWGNPVGDSSWVSFNANSAPDGSYVAPNGSYTYFSTFMDNNPVYSFGNIVLMADDTVSVYLNGNLVVAAAAANPVLHCTEGAPNCMTPSSYYLAPSFFVSGVNTFEFVVNQDFGSATGLDFDGRVSVTPEPSSLMLLGTGLLGSAGAMFRRLRA